MFLYRSFGGEVPEAVESSASDAASRSSLPRCSHVFSARVQTESVGLQLGRQACRRGKREPIGPEHSVPCERIHKLLRRLGTGEAPTAESHGRSLHTRIL